MGKLPRLPKEVRVAHAGRLEHDDRALFGGGFGEVERSPRDAVAFNALGSGFVRLGRFELAIDPYREAIRLDPTLDDFFSVELGFDYLHSGRYEQALPLLEKVLAEAPDMPVANMQYGMAQARLRNYGKAVGPLQKAVKLQPDNGMGHYELGLALFETGDWKSAAPEFEAAKE